MAVDVHTIEVLSESQDVRTDRILFSSETVSNPAGSAAGNPVVVNVTFRALPPNYRVLAQLSQAGDVSITGKSATGFTITIYPPVSTATVAAGTIDLLITA